MAALLPRADESARVVAVGGGKLALEIAGTVIKDRKDRVAFLKDHAGVAGLRRQARRPAAQAVEEGQGRHSERADLVLITSQEIDELCEADNMAQARLPDGRRAQPPAAGRAGAGRHWASRRSSSPPTTATSSPRRSART